MQLDAVEAPGGLVGRHHRAVGALGHWILAGGHVRSCIRAESPS